MLQAEPTEQPQLPPNQLLKLGIELGPLLVFFVANGFLGLRVATGVLIAATAVSMIASRLLLGHIATMLWVTGAFVTVFGALTLWLNDDTFIKMKPTIVNGLFSAILFAGLLMGRPLLRHLFGEAFKLTAAGWHKLTLRWAIFFLFMALLNELVWRTMTTDFWVGFKVFGILPLTLLFAVTQVGLLRRHEQKVADGVS